MKSEPRPVVVHPAFAIEWRDVDDFRGEFGPYNGRYVPRYPSTWLAECLSHLEGLDLKPLERKRLLETASQELRHCTTPGDSPWQDQTTWEANAQQLLRSHPQALVVGNALDPDPFDGWPQSVQQVRDTRRRSWAYRGTVSEYLSACKPLLVNAPAAYLIDPYLDPLAPAVEHLLRSIFDVAKGSRCYQFHIVTRRQACGGKADAVDKSEWLTDQVVLAKLEEFYAARIGKGRSLMVHLVTRGKRNSEHLRLHDRFFLTNFGAISFGRGFVLEKQEHAQETAHVVDRDLHERLKHQYLDGVTRHREGLPRVAGISYPAQVVTLMVSG
jgi:hypothetical protein